MGTARPQRDRRDLSKFETVFEDPEYERLRTEIERREDRVTCAAFAGGSSLETLGGVAAIILGILGFSTSPFYMASAATIAIGIALFAQGAAGMARWRDTLHRLEGSAYDRQELLSGLSTEFFAGFVGVVLGVLALLDVKPLVMLPVACMVFGSAMFLGGSAAPDLVYLTPDRNPKVAHATYGAVQTSAGVMVLVGLAACTLGILGVLSIGPILTKTLVALIAIGAAIAFAGGAATTRFARRLRQA